MATPFIVELIKRILREIVNANPTNSDEEIAEQVMKRIGQTMI